MSELAAFLFGAGIFTLIGHAAGYLKAKELYERRHKK